MPCQWVEPSTAASGSCQLMSDDIQSASSSPNEEVVNSQSSWLFSLLLSAVPGALAGVHLTGLLFFLNPHLPFSPAPWIRAAILLAATFGLLSALLLLPYVRGSVRRAQRMLPWALVAVFVVAAIGDWVHASVLAYYLPSGINRRLIKAAVSLSLAAVIAFYTALLHSFRRRPYGVRSRIGLALLAVLSIYVIVERREAFSPPPEATPRSSAIEPDRRPTLVVVGLEAATLDVVLPLAEQGRLPFFQEIIERGAHGRLETLRPTRREPLWTTMVTGKHPHRHGIVDRVAWSADLIQSGAVLHQIPLGARLPRFVQARSDGPVGGRRRALPLWEIMSRLDIETAVVGWPAAEPLPSNVVAGYTEAELQSAPSGGWDRLDASGALSDVEPKAVPRLEDALQQDDIRLQRTIELLPATGADATDLGLSTVGAVFVALPGLEQVALESFGGYSAVQFDGSQGRREQEAAGLLAAYYAALDTRLERLWQRMPEPRLLAVVSAYGAGTDSGLTKFARRLLRRGDLRGTTATGPDGIFLLRGDGIEPGTLLPAVRLEDVTPTLLYAMGMPLARDFDGTLQSLAFDAEFLGRTPLALVPSYETLTQGLPPSLRPGPTPEPPAGASAGEAP